MTLLLLISIYVLFFRYHHWWDTANPNTYGPVLRTGNTGAANHEGGVFVGKPTVDAFLGRSSGSRLSKN